MLQQQNLLIDLVIPLQHFFFIFLNQKKKKNTFNNIDYYSCHNLHSMYQTCLNIPLKSTSNYFSLDYKMLGCKI